MNSTTKKLAVLITGARAPIALELARSFGAAGHRVIVADCQRLTVARWSRFVDKYILLPSPARQTMDFVSELRRVIIAEKIDHLIPTCEEAFYISRHKDKLSCFVWAAPFALMNQLHSKWAFIQMAKPFFAVPQTKLATDFQDWGNCHMFVFKKIYSRFGLGVIIGGTEQDCEIVRAAPEDWIAQELITGKEVCVYSVWQEGVLKAFSCYHPVYRYGKGAGILFEPVENEQVLNSVKNFGAAYGYTGQLSFDIIIKEGVPYVIECNPRGTSGAHLLSGRLNEAFFCTGFTLMNTDKEYCIRYAMLMRHPLKTMIKRVRKAKDVIFTGDDLAPAFLQALSILEILYIKLSRNQTLLQATTGDIEWNGSNS